eukprot:CAMPEP_0168772226 /NCGR_PEP_ID=MMETSP0725-20121227/3847_1 /TAXON_ID=265536 /ORGANISM="Amphiprora sp., Strain CCMP467" /LENGTH=561 /DNA_ID=CAMNT_0008821737 /DNA_START=197 /DNA_END=1884 /DNA_ORIENTATION=-
MIALSNRISTPQVFFNTRHVGGAKETIELLQKWDQEGGAYQRYVDQVERMHDPCNPRFDPPTDEPVRVDSGPPRGDQEYSICLPWSPSKKVTVLQMMETCKSILPKNQSITKRMMRYKNVFTVAQAVKAFHVHYCESITSKDSMELIRHLIEEQLIVVVQAGESTETNTAASTRDATLSSPSTLLRLQCYATPLVLNSYRVWKEDLQGLTPSQLLRQLANMMSQIHEDITNEHGKINFPAGQEHVLYPAFEEASCALQKVDLSDLKRDEDKIVSLMRWDDMKSKHTISAPFFNLLPLQAFGINLYNLMIKYAFIKVGTGETDYSRLVFFNRVKFQVGPDLYSFQDWENGILRGNRKAPYAMSLQFSNKAKKRDPRLDYVVKNVDARIHFALNCGAESCPPVSYYTARNLHRELHLAAAAFCEDEGNLYIDEDKREVRLSKIFLWYKQDFVENNKQYSERLMKYTMSLKKQQLQKVCDSAQRELKHVKVGSLPYNWSTEAESIATFDLNKHKLQERVGPLQALSQKKRNSVSHPHSSSEEGKTELSASSISSAKLAEVPPSG